jgi:hypothetical protein
MPLSMVKPPCGLDVCVRLSHEGDSTTEFYLDRLRTSQYEESCGVTYSRAEGISEYWIRRFWVACCQSGSLFSCLPFRLVVDRLAGVEEPTAVSSCLMLLRCDDFEARLECIAPQGVVRHLLADQIASNVRLSQTDSHSFSEPYYYDAWLLKKLIQPHGLLVSRRPGRLGNGDEKGGDQSSGD